MDTAFTIGEVARRAGVSPSAIRYYESVGLVEPERRSSGRRLYGEVAVERLALISFAKGAGFTLDEVRQLIDGFPKETPVGARWTELATRCSTRFRCRTMCASRSCRPTRTSWRDACPFRCLAPA